MDLGDIIAIVALVVSLGAAWFAWHQQNASFRLAWYEQVVTWARDCVRAFSGAHELMSAEAHSSVDIPRRKQELMESLTSLVDEGRFIFENDRRSGFGKEKPYAYQGIRPDILDCLVDGYQALQKANFLDPNDRAKSRDLIILLKREFVSDLVKVIEPNWFSRRAKATPKNSKAS